MAKKKEKIIIDTRNTDVRIVNKKKAPAGDGARKIAIFAIKLIILLAVIYILTSAKKVTLKEENNITVTQTKVTQEPYQVVEEYDEKVPYGDKYCVNRPMNFTTVTDKQVGSVNDSLVCILNLTNLEDQEGTWTYDAYIDAYSGRVSGGAITKSIDPHATVTFSWNIELPPGATGASCIVFMRALPSIQKCFYPEPITYRIVTKTRTVTKYRNLTEPESQNVTNVTTATKYVNRFFGYEQGYFFGW